MKKIAAFALSFSALGLLAVGGAGCGNTAKKETKTTTVEKKTTPEGGTATEKKVEEKKVDPAK